jgi:hypothetical protein
MNRISTVGCGPIYKRWPVLDSYRHRITVPNVMPGAAMSEGVCAGVFARLRKRRRGDVPRIDHCGSHAAPPSHPDMGEPSQPPTRLLEPGHRSVSATLTRAKRVVGTRSACYGVKASISGHSYPELPHWPEFISNNIPHLDWSTLSTSHVAFGLQKENEVEAERRFT